MTAEYLCLPCRKQLEEHPQELPRLCFHAYEIARAYYQYNELEQALPKISYAFEVAGIMMTTQFLSPNFTTYMLLTTSKALIHILNQIGYEQESINIYQRTNQMLRKNANQPLKREHQTKLAKLAKLAYGKTKRHLKLVRSEHTATLH